LKKYNDEWRCPKCGSKHLAKVEEHEGPAYTYRSGQITLTFVWLSCQACGHRFQTTFESPNTVFENPS